MIQKMTGLPSNVVGFEASGRVTGLDYKDVLIPAVDKVLKEHDKVSCLYYLGPEFEGFDLGAILQDARVGLAHLTHWDHVALVTDKRWMRESMKAFGYVMPGKFEAFTNDELAEAKEFVCH